MATRRLQTNRCTMLPSELMQMTSLEASQTATTQLWEREAMQCQEGKSKGSITAMASQ